QAGTAMCLTKCQTDGDCAASTDYCAQSTGTCMPKKAQGVTCSGAGECSSGFCADGICCNSACMLSCQSCLTGTCGPRATSATTLCGSTCIDTSSDPNHCGGCGAVCQGDCVGGQCVCAWDVSTWDQCIWAE